jgi:molybdenum cofactor synthesis domain-containing protein
MDVRSKGFATHTTVETSLNKLLDKIEVKDEKEVVVLLDAVNRVLAEDIVSERNVPHFNRAAMDGYAVRAEDTFGASPDSPLLLKVTDKIEIGEKRQARIEKGEAVRIATGAAMPEGSNAVVMIEYTIRLNDMVEIYRAVTPAENVSLTGEDVKIGEKILEKGTILQPQDIGMLAALGRTSVEVFKKPVVAVLSTGDELVNPEKRPESGEIVDVNRFSVISALKLLGCDVIDCGICRDDKQKIEEKVIKELKNADMLIVSGGTSVGERDLLPEIIKKLGEIVVHGVAIKPGMPVALAVVSSKPVILLPGFPVAALVAFYNFVPPILEKMLNACIWQKYYVKARASKRIPSREGIRTFTRVIIKKTVEGYIAEPIRTSGSGILSSMVKAHGFAIIPEDSEGVEEGDEIDVLILRSMGCFHA